MIRHLIHVHYVGMRHEIIYISKYIIPNVSQIQCSALITLLIFSPIFYTPHRVAVRVILAA